MALSNLINILFTNQHTKSMGDNAWGGLLADRVSGLLTTQSHGLKVYT